MLQINISEFISYSIGTFIINLTALFLVFKIIFQNLKNKIIIFPISIFIFFLLNTILDNQLYLPSIIEISVCLYLSLIFVISHFITYKNSKLIPIVILNVSILIHLHVMYIFPVLLIILILFFYIIKNFKDFYLNFLNNLKFVLPISIIIISVFIFPILYDQFFLSGNISKILNYSSTQESILLINFLNELTYSLKFVTAYFFYPFNSKEEILLYTSSGKFYELGSIFFIFFLVVFFVIFYIINEKINNTFLNNLVLFLILSLICGVFLSLKKTDGVPVFNAEYAMRYLFSIVILFYLIFIFIIDNLKFEKINFFKIFLNKNIFTFLIIFIFIFIMPSSKNFFNLPIIYEKIDQTKDFQKTGYFSIYPRSTDPDLENVYKNVFKKFDQKVSFSIESNNWPLAAGILNLALRKKHKIEIEQDFFKNFLKHYKLFEKAEVRVIMTDRKIENLELLYNYSNRSFFYLDYLS